jgi:hypothetical protein
MDVERAFMPAVVGMKLPGFEPPTLYLAVPATLKLTLTAPLVGALIA